MNNWKSISECFAISISNPWQSKHTSVGSGMLWLDQHRGTGIWNNNTLTFIVIDYYSGIRVNSYARNTCYFVHIHSKITESIFWIVSHPIYRQRRRAFRSDTKHYSFSFVYVMAYLCMALLSYTCVLLLFI